MDFNAGFLEGWDLVPDLIASDFNADVTGTRFFAGHSKKVYWMLQKPAGTAGDDFDITFNQATAASGGSTKVLTTSRFHYKKASSSNTFAPSILWTNVVLTTPISQFLGDSTPSDLTLDTVAAVVLFELDACDVTNGYNWIFVQNEGDGIANALVVNAYYLSRDVYAQAIPVSKA